MTTNVQQLPRVPRTKVARCTDCEARYGRHDDGACPQCGADLDVRMDRPAVVVEAHAEQVRELAREHAPSAESEACGDYAVCQACVENTPLACDTASDVARYTEFEAAVDEAIDAVERLGGDDGYVYSHLADKYTAAYFEACAPAAECFVCHDAQFDEDMDCGHTRHGRECPAAE